MPKFKTTIKTTYDSFRTHQTYCPVCGEMFSGIYLYGLDSCHMMCLSCVPNNADFTNKSINLDD